MVMDEVSDAERRAALDPKVAIEILRKAQVAIQAKVAARWWEICDKVVVRYNDGFYNFPDSAPLSILPIVYPTSWLKMLGFNDEFIYPAKHWLAPISESNSFGFITVICILTVVYSAGFLVAYTFMGRKSKSL